MDYRSLFKDVKKRPNSYGLSGSYDQYVAFISGCDAGNDWGLLVAFPHWISLRQGVAGANLNWSAHISRIVRQESQSGVTGDSESRKIETLFSLLDEYLEERNGGMSVPLIIEKYSLRVAREKE